MTFFIKRILLPLYRSAPFLMLMATPCHANTGVTVKVTVAISPPCVINGNRPIEVDFGEEVMTTRIDGDHYRIPINYTLICNGHSTNTMRLRIQGSTAYFDRDILSTNKSGLGIKIISNGVVWPVNALFNFSYPAVPVLEAVPVKQSEVKLTTGKFTSAAVMEVFYQ